MEQKAKFDVEKLKELINNGQGIKITFPTINRNIEDSLKIILNELLAFYKRSDFMELMYSTLKELFINGVKANMKHYYFNEMAIDLSNPDHVKKGYEALKEKLNEKNLIIFDEIARAANLNIILTLHHSKDRLLALVENNSPMNSNEDERIRDKFQKALKYESIADYYMECGDDTEGTGLGISMIVLLLKGCGIDPHAFTISSKDSTTVAKIEVPLHPGYVISRNMSA